MNGREYILLIDDDRDVAEGLALLLERDGRTTIVCSDVESAEMILSRYPVTHVVSDVQFSGSFGFEGLHFLTRIRMLRAGCRIILMTGHASRELCAAAIGLGAAAVLEKPFNGDELERALASTLYGEGDYELLRVPPIDDLLYGDQLTAVYQPIVRLGDGGGVFGFEALTRVTGPWAAGGPAELFDYAQRRQRLADLNLAAIGTAIAGAVRLPHAAALFVNVDPSVFNAASLGATVRAQALRHGFPLDRLVLEITERSAFGSDGAAFRVVEELRAAGVRFALDDHGSAYSHLGAINAIRPSLIKISQSFGTGFESDDTRTRIVRHVAALAREFGCRTVLEGIETAATAAAATALGVELAQGFHFGRPSPASHWTTAAAA
ncbi:MAG TPA: EAL domain-containing protein [Thermoanaerobaculia bacterium]|jgi:EAL domain-containing protein (putative c-di-GMP-specific phosphodiesterase class I)|nr:EAL domain-containing protein [Thermoanaerobaculia bacterium]